MHRVLVGATIVLPIASWERRFISEQRLDLSRNSKQHVGMKQNDDAGQGGGEDGTADSSADGSADGSANDVSGDGFYGMMLMSSTHHRFSGLFTIRGPRSPPVTQLLVRGAPTAVALGGPRPLYLVTGVCGLLCAQARSLNLWRTCSCTQPTTRCVLPLCTPTPTRPHACTQDTAAWGGPVTLVTPAQNPTLHESPGGFQALAQALTTSMVGRRLALACSDLTVDLYATTVTWMVDACNEIVQLS